MENLLEQLNAPFPYEAYRSNYEGKCYVGVNWIVERLNEVLSPLNWIHEVIEITEYSEEQAIEVYGKLSIYNQESKEWVSRYQLGNDTMTALKDSGIVTPQARMDCKKSAVSDCLKKTASLFGVALDVYKDLITIIKNGNALYQKLANAYPKLVDTYVIHKNGIPILPDSYKEYYKEHGLEGIFKSDMLSLVDNKSSSSESSSSKEQPALPTTSNSANNAAATKTSNTKSSNTKSSTTSNPTPATTSSNSPTTFRVQVKSKPVFNQDRSSTFQVMLEDKREVKVLAGKQVEKQIEKLSINEVIIFSGWLKNEQIRLAHSKKITSETKSA